MKRHLVNIINILYLFFLLSCTSQSTVSINNGYVDFPEVRALKAKTIQLDTALFCYPFGCMLGTIKLWCWICMERIIIFMHSVIRSFIICLLLEKEEIHPKRCFRLKTSDGVKMLVDIGCK